MKGREERESEGVEGGRERKGWVGGGAAEKRERDWVDIKFCFTPCYVGCRSASNTLKSW